MIVTPTPLDDAAIIDIEKIGDDRGFFARAWCARELGAGDAEASVVQANMGYCAKRDTLRGLHYQKAPHEERKWIRCVRGAVFDVLVDLRPGSSTYKQWFGTELTAENRRMMYIPKGFAHGYLSLRDDTEVIYFVSEYYAPQAESGVRWNDPEFGIDWPLAGEPILSGKDRSWPDFQDA